MKKQLSKITLGVALFAATYGIAQDGKIQPCNTYAAMEEVFKANPGAEARYNALQEEAHKQYVEAEKNKGANKTSAAFQYTIPVVFHVLHQGGGENVSDATCAAALAQMNLDYAAAGSDANTIAAPFQSLYINSDIKFMLARRDPNNNCTSGIVHHLDSRTVWSQGGFATNYNGITWDPTKYLNIIIVKQIVPTGTVTGGGIIVGYTYKPGTLPTGALQDAIVYNYGFLTGMTNIRSLSHEAGHWLNLSHTFGNTNNPGVVCGDDGISDTPWTKGNFSACPTSLSGNVCTGGPTQNVENIMDYSSCPKNFTSGQTTVMRNALASATSGRNNLSAPANLAATDINGTLPCPPVAEFMSTTNYTVCSGGSLNFKDLSYNGTISSYAWSGDNGAMIANPTLSNTAITFPTQGVSSITLTVTNPQGSSTKIKTVTVLNGAAVITGNYFESFENAGVPANWSVTNVGGGVTWDQTTVAAKNGSGSFYLDGTQSAVNQVDMLTMPVMDVVNNPNNLLKFSYAYARQTATHADKLVLQGSLDCGASWIDVVSLNAGTMAANSGGTTSTPYVPVLADWKEVDVTSYPYWFNFANSPSATFRFVFTEDATNGFGNRLYIDAVDFQGPNGLNELAKSYKLNLFPNPSTGETNLKFNLSDAATVTVNVVDMLGKDVLPATINTYNAGEQTVAINKNSALSKGIYFVNISINGSKMSKKLVIN